MQQSNKSFVCQAFQASSLMYLFLDQVWWFFKLVAQCKLWLATTVAHLVKPATLKHHATKQDVIFLSSVSSIKFDVPYSWPSVVVLQVGSTVQTLIGYHFARLVRPVSTKHHATKQDVIFLSSVLSVKLDVPYSWLSVVVLKVGSTVQIMIGYHFAHLVRPVSTKQHATKQDVIFLSSVSSVKLDVPFLDQVWWFFKLVAQCKLWLATSVAHLVKPATLKHHATKQQIICLSSVSSVKLDVPFSWPSVVVLQVGSTVQTMIGYHCGTSCEASDFETSCNKATNHLFIKRFKRQAWCTFFLTKCGGSSSW